MEALGSIVAPPGSNVILALPGLLLLPSARRFATLVVLVAVGSLYFSAHAEDLVHRVAHDGDDIVEDRVRRHDRRREADDVLALEPGEELA